MKILISIFIFLSIAIIPLATIGCSPTMTKCIEDCSKFCGEIKEVRVAHCWNDMWEAIHCECFDGRMFQNH